MAGLKRSEKAAADPYGEILARMTAGQITEWMALKAEMQRAHSAEIDPENVPRVRIPRLTERNARRYIAAVSEAVRLRDVDPQQATAMLYATQLLLAASKAFPARPRKQPNGSATPAPKILDAIKASRGRR